MAARLAYDDFDVSGGELRWADETRSLADLKSADFRLAAHVALIATVAFMALIGLGAVYLIVAFGDAAVPVAATAAMIVGFAAASWAIRAWVVGSGRASEMILAFRTEKSVALPIVTRTDAERLVDRITQAASEYRQSADLTVQTAPAV